MHLKELAYSESASYLSELATLTATTKNSWNESAWKLKLSMRVIEECMVREREGEEITKLALEFSGKYQRQILNHSLHICKCSSGMKLLIHSLIFITLTTLQ